MGGYFREEGVFIEWMISTQRVCIHAYRCVFARWVVLLKVNVPSYSGRTFTRYVGLRKDQWAFIEWVFTGWVDLQKAGVTS